jgi:hypothetical protein
MGKGFLSVFWGEKIVYRLNFLVKTSVKSKSFWTNVFEKKLKALGAKKTRFGKTLFYFVSL